MSSDWTEVSLLDCILLSASKTEMVCVSCNSFDSTAIVGGWVFAVATTVCGDSVAETGPEWSSET